MRWVRRGCQRSALIRILRKPMTPIEICEAALEFSPRILLPDVIHLLREFEIRRLVICLNSAQKTRKLYVLTELGRTVAGQAVGVFHLEGLESIDWVKYSFVVRAKDRRVVLKEFDRSTPMKAGGKTVVEIRERLKERHPIGICMVNRVVKELLGVGLIESVGTMRKGRTRLYIGLPKKVGAFWIS